MKIRKYAVIGCIWFMALAIQVTSKTESIGFEIHYDSSTTSTYELKDEILTRYTDLIEGVHDESAVQMILYNLDQFAWNDTLEATWNYNRLIVTEGDGQGTFIQGDLQSKGICFPEVQPKSWIAEFFQ